MWSWDILYETSYILVISISGRKLVYNRVPIVRDLILSNIFLSRKISWNYTRIFSACFHSLDYFSVQIDQSSEFDSEFYWKYGRTLWGDEKCRNYTCHKVQKMYWNKFYGFSYFLFRLVSHGESWKLFRKWKSERIWGQPAKLPASMSDPQESCQPFQVSGTYNLHRFQIFYFRRQ